jgi:hypothetical protein
MDNKIINNISIKKNHIPNDIIKEFIDKNPTEEEFKKFLLTGINFYFLYRNEIPDYLQRTYNDVQRILYHR